MVIFVGGGVPRGTAAVLSSSAAIALGMLLYPIVFWCFWKSFIIAPRFDSNSVLCPSILQLVLIPSQPRPSRLDVMADVNTMTKFF